MNNYARANAMKFYILKNNILEDSNELKQMNKHSIKEKTRDNSKIKLNFNQKRRQLKELSFNIERTRMN